LSSLDRMEKIFPLRARIGYPPCALYNRLTLWNLNLNVKKEYAVKFCCSSKLSEPGKREEWLKRTKASGMEIKEFLAPGCKYASVCPQSFEKCKKERPPLFMVKGVKVACWLYEEQ